MSGGTFDYLQFHLQDLVFSLKEVVENYENAKTPNDIEYELPGISENSDIDQALIEDMKVLADRLHRDYLWTEYLDKYLSGDISREKYMSMLEIIKFENLDDYVFDNLYNLT